MYNTVNVTQFGGQSYEPHKLETNYYEHKKAQEQKVLSKEQVEKLFWDKLVNLGWRKSEIPADGQKLLTQLVLVCPDCDKSTITIMANSVTREKAELLHSEFYIKQAVDQHKASSKGCKPLE